MSSFNKLYIYLNKNKCWYLGKLGIYKFLVAQYRHSYHHSYHSDNIKHLHFSQLYFGTKYQSNVTDKDFNFLEHRFFDCYKRSKYAYWITWYSNPLIRKKHRRIAKSNCNTYLVKLLFYVNRSKNNNNNNNQTKKQIKIKSQLKKYLNGYYNHERNTKAFKKKRKKYTTNSNRIIYAVQHFNLLSINEEFLRINRDNIYNSKNLIINKFLNNWHRSILIRPQYIWFSFAIDCKRYNIEPINTNINFLLFQQRLNQCSTKFINTKCIRYHCCVKSILLDNSSHLELKKIYDKYSKLYNNNNLKNNNNNGNINNNYYNIEQERKEILNWLNSNDCNIDIFYRQNIINNLNKQ